MQAPRLPNLSNKKVIKVMLHISEKFRQQNHKRCRNNTHSQYYAKIQQIHKKQLLTRIGIHTKLYKKKTSTKLTEVWCNANLIYWYDNCAAATKASSVYRSLWWSSYLSRSPLKICIDSSTVGSGTLTGWNLRSKAGSFSICFLYSSSVVAPMHWEIEQCQKCWN